MSGATLELTRESQLNFDKTMKKLSTRTTEAARQGIVKFLYQIQTLAQDKLTSDGHIVTSRLKSSIAIKTPKITPGSYSDKDGKNYKGDFDVTLGENEAAVGTNVEYANKIEYLYDSFLYYAAKHADVDKLAKEISKELKLT